MSGAGSPFVWLASYPKSGNTWMRVFLANLMSPDGTAADINRLEVLNSADRALFDGNSGLRSSELRPDEIARLRGAALRMAARNRLRAGKDNIVVVKSHEASDADTAGAPLFPREAIRVAVCLVRDPRDVAVSLAQHRGRPVEETVTKMADDDWVIRPQANGCGPRLPERWSSWSHNVESWTSRDDIPLIVIRYEDLHARPIEIFTSVARAVVPQASDARIADAVDASRFNRLATQEAESGFRERPPESARFFRRGETGSWRSELAPSEAARIVDRHRAMMARFGYLT